jgi:hypothetical protein
MVIFCEECGEKHILPEHLSGIPAEFHCRKCHEILYIPQSSLHGSQTEQRDKSE